MEQTIGQFCSVKTGPFGTLLKASEYTEIDGVPVISVGEVREGYFRVTEHTPLVPERVQQRLPQYLLQAGDVVFGRKGAVERSALVRTHQAGWFLGSDGIAVRPTGGHCPEYVAAQFQSFRVRQWLALNSTGTTMASMNQSVLSRVSIPFPPTFDEERSISEALADADALLSSLEQLLTKKRQIKQGAMQELLTGKRRLRQEDPWHTLRLGDTATLKARIGWQGLTTAEYKERGEHLLVTGTEFRAGRISWDACHYVDQDRYEQDKNIQLAVNDVLVTKDGTIGKVALVDSLPIPATLNSGVFVVRPRNMAFHPGFFYCLLASPVFTSFLGQLSAGSTINHLYQKDFVHFTFEAPRDLQEQQEIYEAISEIDSDIAALESRLTKARALKQAMAQALLTGRIRLVEPTA